MDEQKAREYYVKIKTMRDKVQQLTEHINEIDQKTVDLRSMIDAVKQATDISDGDEILAPLTNGVMIPATAKKTQTLYLNVGADTVIEKTPQETEEILEKQLTELTEYRKKMMSQRQQLAQQAAQLEEEVAKEIDV